MPRTIASTHIGTEKCSKVIEIKIVKILQEVAEKKSPSKTTKGKIDKYLLPIGQGNPFLQVSEI